MSSTAPIINCECTAKRRVIALEGLIGAGKSTLVDKIKRSDPTVEVLKEQINPQMLDLFYGNPGKYGFAMQWAALLQRIYQSKLLQLGKGQCDAATTCVWDRSMLGDYAFALWNHLTGNLNREEMDAYESMFGANVSRDNPAFLRDTPFVNHIDTYFWLVDDPMECKRRVELRQSNPAEQGIPDQYYQGLEDVHIFLFLKLLSDPEVNHKVKVRNWEQYHQASSLEDLLREPVRPASKTSSSPDEAAVTGSDDQRSGYLEQLPPTGIQGQVNGVLYNLPALVVNVTHSKTGVQQDVIDRYGFYFLTEDSKAALYQHLSSGGDPMSICMNMNDTPV